MSNAYRESAASKPEESDYDLAAWRARRLHAAEAFIEEARTFGIEPASKLGQLLAAYDLVQPYGGIVDAKEGA